MTFIPDTTKADREKKHPYSVRKGSTIIIANREYSGSKGATVELTKDEAKNKYSHQIEPIPADTKNDIEDIANNKAIKKSTVNKK